jgi:DnaJ-class molecular chaperone
MSNKIDICKKCKGEGLIYSLKIYRMEELCPDCEGTGVKLVDKHTEIANFIGGEMYEDDPNYKDVTE